MQKVSEHAMMWAKFSLQNICNTTCVSFYLLCHVSNLSIFDMHIRNYNRGDCGSCTVSVGGSRIKACVGKVPPMPRLKSLQEKGLVVK